jgi:hypothetical protein
VALRRLSARTRLVASFASGDVAAMPSIGLGSSVVATTL